MTKPHYLKHRTVLYCAPISPIDEEFSNEQVEVALSIAFSRLVTDSLKLSKSSDFREVKRALTIEPTDN